MNLLSYSEGWVVIYKVTILYLRMSISDLVSLFTILTLINYLIVLGVSSFYFFFYFSKLDKLFYSVLYWSVFIALTVISDKVGLLIFDRTSQEYLLLTIFNYLVVCFILLPLISGVSKLVNSLKQILLNQVIINQFYSLAFEGILIGLKTDDAVQDTEFNLVDCNLAFCKLVDKSRTDVLGNSKDIFDSETTKSLIEIIKNKTYACLSGYVKTRSERLTPVKIVVQYFTVKSLDYFCLSIIDATDADIIKKVEFQTIETLERQFDLLSKKEPKINVLLSNLDQLSVNDLTNFDFQDLILQTEGKEIDSIFSSLESDYQTPVESELERELFSKFNENNFCELVPDLDELLGVS